MALALITTAAVVFVSKFIPAGGTTASTEGTPSQSSSVDVSKLAAQCDTSGAVAIAKNQYPKDVCGKAAYYFLISKGLTPAQAAGIVGNLEHESSGVNPLTDSHCQGGCSRGIAQFGYGGVAGNKYGEIQSKYGAAANTELAQLEFLWDDLNANYASTLAEIKSSNDPVSVSRIFSNEYERPSHYGSSPLTGTELNDDPDAHQDVRDRYATQIAAGNFEYTGG